VTNSNDRLDRIEIAVERTQRQINEGFQRTQQQIDSNARAFQANSESITVVAEAAGRTLRAVDELRERVEEDRVNFREFVERADTAIAGINATLAAVNTSIANQGRILDYLLLHRNGNGDGPQP
jgi:chromosome segregation ATPase